MMATITRHFPVLSLLLALALSTLCFSESIDTSLPGRPASSTGVIRQRKRIEEGLFPKPKRPKSKLKLPRVSRTTRRRCDKSARQFRKKYGFFSKGQHACCLFGRKGGFCGKDFEKGRVCNDAPFRYNKAGAVEALPSDRSMWSKHLVNRRCCINYNKGSKPQYRMDCLDDQSIEGRKCDASCVRKDRRCRKGGSKLCQCNYQQVWTYNAKYKKVSAFLDVGITIFGNTCHIRDANSGGVGGYETCCGIGMHPFQCAYWRRLCAYRRSK